MGMTRAIKTVTGFHGDRKGAAAVEFALCLPFMLLLLFGTYQVAQAVTAYRKVTITTRTVADLTTQYTTMASSDMSNVLNASTQIMSPFNASNVSITLTEFQLLPTGGVVVWSATRSGACVQHTGSTVSLPTGLGATGSYIVRADVSYVYSPPVGYNLTGPFTIKDQIYMAPRKIASISFSGVC